MAEGPVRIGRVVGAFGIRGELKVEAFLDAVERLEPGAGVRLAGEERIVEAIRFHQGRPILKLAGMDDRTAAEAVRGGFLEARVDSRALLQPDEFLIRDLIGMRVITGQGEELGTVERIHPYPAQDVLEVAGILIPLAKQFVRRVDVEGRTITVELIPGMRPGEES